MGPCKVWGFLTVWPELGGSDGSGGPPFLGGGTSKSEKLQAQGKGQGGVRTCRTREWRTRAPQGAGSFPPGPEVQSCARLLPPGTPGEDSVEKSGPEWVGGCFLRPGLLGAESGAAHSSPRVAAPGSDGQSTQLVGLPSSQGRRYPLRAPPLPGPGRGVRRGRPVPRPRREGTRLGPPVPVPARPAPLPDTH